MSVFFSSIYSLNKNVVSYNEVCLLFIFNLFIYAASNLEINIQFVVYYITLHVLIWVHCYIRVSMRVIISTPKFFDMLNRMTHAMMTLPARVGSRRGEDSEISF